MKEDFNFLLIELLFTTKKYVMHLFYILEILIVMMIWYHQIFV